MVTLSLSPENVVGLEGQGYRIAQWVGFDDHMVPVYTHHDVADKKTGDVIFKARVGNPKGLNDAEANYLAKKASYGYFTWKPGAACLARKFRKVEFRKRPLGGTERIEHPAEMGCRWCRERAALIPIPPAPVEPVLATATPPQLEAEPVLPVQKCKFCGWQPAKHIKKIDFAFTLHMRGHAMRKAKASATAKPVAPANG